MVRESKSELKSEQHRLLEEIKEIIIKNYPEFKDRRIRFIHVWDKEDTYPIPMNIKLDPYTNVDVSILRTSHGMSKHPWAMGSTSVVIDQPKGIVGKDLIGVSYCSDKEHNFWRLKGRVEALKRTKKNLQKQYTKHQGVCSCGFPEIDHPLTDCDKTYNQQEKNLVVGVDVAKGKDKTIYYSSGGPITTERLTKQAQYEFDSARKNDPAKEGEKRSDHTCHLDTIISLLKGCNVLTTDGRIIQTSQQVTDYIISCVKATGKWSTVKDLETVFAENLYPCDECGKRMLLVNTIGSHDIARCISCGHTTN